MFVVLFHFCLVILLVILFILLILLIPFLLLFLSYNNTPFFCRQDEHEGASPLQLLRRVREGGMWWLLVEYDDEYETQGWKGFADEAAVAEYSQVNVGEPLEIPPVSLSPGESATVVSGSGSMKHIYSQKLSREKSQAVRVLGVNRVGV